MNELEKPVRLTKVTDLKANVSVGWRSGIHVKLTWTPSTDERVVYHIYRESGNGPKKIGEVTGEGSYRVNSVKVFKIHLTLLCRSIHKPMWRASHPIQ